MLRPALRRTGIKHDAPLCLDTGSGLSALLGQILPHRSSPISTHVCLSFFFTLRLQLVMKLIPRLWDPAKSSGRWRAQRVSLSGHGGRDGRTDGERVHADLCVFLLPEVERCATAVTATVMGFLFKCAATSWLRFRAPGS